MRSGARTAAAALLYLVSGAALGADFYVAPNASANGNGSIGNPWKLQTALSQPSSVHAGDTIWLRGGAYTSDLTGTASSPIIVREYPGEHAKIDSGDSNGIAALLVRGAYAWYWGFEIMSSDPVRLSSETGPWPSDIGRGDGVASGPVPSTGLEFTNLLIQDHGQGLGACSA